MIQVPLISDFSGGKLSEKLSGRFDLPLYWRGAKEMRNFVPMSQGGAALRQGSFLVSLDLSSFAVNKRMMPWVATDGLDKFLVIIHSNGTTSEVAVYQAEDNGTVTQRLASTSITGVGYSQADLNAMQYAQIRMSGTSYFIAVTRGKPPLMLALSGSTVTIAAAHGATTAWAASTAYSIGDMRIANNRVYRCVKAGTSGTTPPDSYDLEAAIVDGTCEWRCQWPFGGTGNYPVAVAFFGQRLWYGGTENSPQSIYASRIGDLYKFDLVDRLEWDSPVLVVNSPRFAWKASTNYSAGQLRHNAGNVYKCIVSGTSASSGGPTGTGTDITDGSAHWAYQRAAPDALQPLLDASFKPAYEIEKRTEDLATDATGIQLSIASDQGETVAWMQGGRGLIVGTTIGEYVIPPEASGINPLVYPRSRNGSERIAPVSLRAASYAVLPGGRRLTEYPIADDNAGGGDITAHADDAVTGAIIQLETMQAPEPVILYLMDDGAMGYCLRTSEAAAHARIELSSSTIRTISVLPFAGGDRLYAIITDPGGSSRLVSFFALHASNQIAIDIAVPITFSGSSPISLPESLPYTLGAVLAVVDSDGREVDGSLSAGGSYGVFTPSVAQTGSGWVGLRINGVLETMRVPSQSQIGANFLQPVNVTGLDMRLYRTRSFKTGESVGLLNAFIYAGEYTGDHEIGYPAGYASDATLRVIQDRAEPVTILAIAPRVEVA